MVGRSLPEPEGYYHRAGRGRLCKVAGGEQSANGVTDYLHH